MRATRRQLWPSTPARPVEATRGLPRSSQGVRSRPGGERLAPDGNDWLRGRRAMLRGLPGAGMGTPRW